jgi:hypothetical protein
MMLILFVSQYCGFCHIIDVNVVKCGKGIGILAEQKKIGLPIP